MNIPEFKDWLIKEGRSVSKNVTPTSVDWYAYKVFRGFKDCLCNEKPPPVCVYPAYIQYSDGREYISCEVKVVGEVKKNQWVDFNFYSIQLDQFVKEHKGMIAKLKKAWNGVVN